MTVRKAIEKDIPRLGDLLRQVCLVHHNGRPDLFNAGRKYTDEQLKDLLADANAPILVAVDETDTVLGYCFCVYQQPAEGGALKAVKTLYIDDLCVDENCRGKGIGKAVYQEILRYAKMRRASSVTLNVWCCNESAMKFYESLGLKPQKIGMEVKLQ